MREKAHCVLKRLQGSIVSKNIILSGIFKSLNVVLNLLFVRISLQKLTFDQFGLWLTLYSIISWMTLFDLGFGSGLRNKLSVYIAKDNLPDACKYVSTTYVIFSVIFGLLSFLCGGFIILFKYLIEINHWQIDLLSLYSFGIVFIGSAILFWIKLINVIFQSDNKVYIPEILAAAGQLIVVVVILIFDVKDIVLFAAINMVSPIMVYLVMTIYSFKWKYYQLYPKLKFFSREIVRDIFSVSRGFFLIQVFGVIIFSSDSIILGKLMSYEYVTLYNIPYRYFSVLLIIFGIVVSPYWSLSAIAFSRNDIDWIRKAIVRLLKVSFYVFVLGLLMTVIANQVYSLWLNQHILVPFGITLGMFLYICILNLAAIYNTICYGTGKIRGIVLVTVIGSIFSISIKIIGISFFGLGLEIVLIANILYAFVAFIVAYRSLKNLNYPT